MSQVDVLSRCAKAGPLVCWPWPGCRTEKDYARIRHDGRTVLAHRFAYEAMVGRIPRGLTIDHLCRNRACVNPNHMEIVTSGENVLRGFGPCAVNARKTHCKNGHEFTPENTRLRLKRGGHGCRVCRACARRYAREQYWIARAALADDGKGE